MIFTTRQLQDLHKTNGHVTLPVGARLTPLAQDFLRHKKLTINYAAKESPKPVSPNGNGGITGGEPALSEKSVIGSSTAPSAGGFLWWCDGPCGASKAAIAAESRETDLHPLDIPAESKLIVQVIKRVAADIKNDQIAGAVLLVQSASAATVYANRCPSLRAIVGTCRASVEQGVQLIAANVLIIEHPHNTLSQVRNMLSRFLKANRTLSDEVKQQLEELASCA